MRPGLRKMPKSNKGKLSFLERLLKSAPSEKPRRKCAKRLKKESERRLRRGRDRKMKKG